MVALSLAPVGADAEQRKAEFDRIVSIGGSVTEIIYALEQQHRLIARDTTSSFPAEVMTLPDVGYMRALSPEGVLSVTPNLIVAEEGSGPPEAIDLLKAASVSFVTVPDKFSSQGIIDKVLAVGWALGVESKAQALAKSLTLELAAAEAAANVNDGSQKKVLFVLSVRGGRILASGTNTAADGIIRMAGAINAISEFEGYKLLSDEAIIAAAPDIILMMDRGGDHSTAADELFALPAVATTPAAQSRAIIRMNGLYLLGFGPRTGKAILQLSKALYTR
ncbi:MAG: ABC transporter substrate-binding protein [Paracoccaceae bacterium]